MTSTIIGSILLYCGVGRSDKEFLIQITNNPLSPIGQQMFINSHHGPAGKVHQGKDYGLYNANVLKKLLADKVAKGYEIRSVNNKPFTSGIQADALLLMSNHGNWNETATAQPTPPPKIRVVEVTFDVGQTAPIW